VTGYHDWLPHYCTVCGKYTDDAPHHREPKSRGGEDTIENLVAVCLQCHATYHSAMGQVPSESNAGYKRIACAKNLNRLCRTNQGYWKLASDYAQTCVEDWMTGALNAYDVGFRPYPATQQAGGGCVQGHTEGWSKTGGGGVVQDGDSTTTEGQQGDNQDTKEH